MLAVPTKFALEEKCWCCDPRERPNLCHQEWSSHLLKTWRPTVPSVSVSDLIVVSDPWIFSDLTEFVSASHSKSVRSFENDSFEAALVGIGVGTRET